MGKKRTSTTKKKQIAKKTKLSSTYGVSVLKGGTIARNNGVLDSKLASIDGNSSAKNTSGSSCDGAKHATSGTASQRTSAGFDRHTAGKHRPQIGNTENDEFRHMHASLEERSLAVQARQDEQRQMKKNRRNGRQTKGFGSFARPSTATLFAPATLTLAPKTTQELVDDATNQVAQGMNEFGRHATIEQIDGSSEMQGRSSLAAAASLNWKIRVSNVTSQLSAQENNNPYAALDNDSDSDNSWAEKDRKLDRQRFQFKPASFSYQPTIVADVSVVAPCSGDDIDPDL